MLSAILTVICSVTWSVGRSEAGVDYSPHFFSLLNHVVVMASPHLHEKDREVCIKTSSPPASILLKGQATQHTTIKWTIYTGSRIK